MQNQLKPISLLGLILAIPFLTDLLYSRNGWGLSGAYTFVYLSFAVGSAVHVSKVYMRYSKKWAALGLEAMYLLGLYAYVSWTGSALLQEKLSGVFLQPFTLLFVQIISRSLNELKHNEADSKSKKMYGQKLLSRLVALMLAFHRALLFIANNLETLAKNPRGLVLSKIYLGIAFTLGAGCFFYTSYCSVITIFCVLAYSSFEATRKEYFFKSVFIFMALGLYAPEGALQPGILIGGVFLSLFVHMSLCKKAVPYVWVYSILLIRYIYPSASMGDAYQIIFIATAMWLCLSCLPVKSLK